MISKNHCVTYPEYNLLIDQTIKKLQQCNLTRGDKLAIISENCIEYPILLMALFNIGVIAVPVSPRFPSQQIEDLLRKIQCNTIHGATNQEKTDHGAHFLGNSEWNIVSIDKSISYENKNCTKRMPDCISFLQHMSNEMQDQEATIIFTSGSAGEPKAVVHTLGNHYFSALGSNINIPFTCEDRWLLSLPLYHVGGLAILMRALLGKGTVVIPDDTISLIENIEKFDITHLSLVSTQLYRLLQHEKNIKSLRRLKALLLGGSAISPALIRKANKNNLPIHTSYGSTEMSSQITTTQPGEEKQCLYTSGKLLEHRELKITEDGEILVKGRTLCKGYIEGTTIHPNRDEKGWFHTGDLGRLDTNGYLIVTGRKDNLFISGGENIQPEEIERQLCTIEGIVQAVVVPIEHAEFGQRPVAFIKTLNNRSIKEDHIRKKLAGKIARFKIPDYFFPYPPSLPQETIKPSRSFFQDLAREKGF
ncbi:MAG: o-succinylbenzoate--CoA ligase [bacterium]